MASNSRTEYKVIADKLASPDDNIIVELAGDLYKGSVSPGNKYVTASEAGGGGGELGPQTWTYQNDATYEIHQAHGGIQVELESATTHGYSEAYVLQNYIAESYVELAVNVETHAILTSLYDESVYKRKITVNDGSNTYRVTSFSPAGEGVWGFSIETNISLYAETNYYIEIQYGGAPVVWWNADDLESITNFRGAKIEYHCYSQDAGNMVGTIYIAHDSGDHNVTHMEVSSGANDMGTVVLWKRDSSEYDNERKLYAYRVDAESDTLRIHWTAQIYCGPELYD